MTITLAVNSKYSNINRVTPYINNNYLIGWPAAKSVGLR